MQALPISNPSTGNAPSPAAAALLPSNPAASSPFTAIFQAALKGAGNANKIPTTGKPQDSSREPARTSGPANNGLVLFPLAVSTLPIAPVLPEPIPALADAPLQTAAGSDSNSVKGAAASTNLLRMDATVGLAVNSFQASSTLQTATASDSNSVKGAAATSNPPHLEATAGLAVNSFQGSGAPPAKAALTAAEPSTTQTSNFGDMLPSSTLAQNAVGTATVTVISFEPRPNSNAPTGSTLPANALQSPVSGATVAQVNSPGTNGACNLANVSLTTAAAQTIPVSVISDANFISQHSGPPPDQSRITDILGGNQSQPQGNPTLSFTAPQNLAASSPNLPNSQIALAGHANSSSRNTGMLNPAVADTNASVTVPPQSTPNQSVQLNSQPPASAATAPAETLAHTVAKSVAIGATAFKFHDNSQLPGANPASPASTAPGPAKPQSQDPSNGSPGKDSNLKQDSASNGANARTADKSFVQSLDVSAANPVIVHTPAADSAGIASATAVPAQNTSSGAPPAAPASPNARPGESLPTAAQNALVVSAAHIVNQSGQTEIRIEMQADSLGGVELRAHIAGDQIGASIAVEHHDAQLALTSDLPALHSALIEKNLRVETLTVSQGSFSSLSGGPGQDTGHRGFFAQTPAKFAYLEQPETPLASTEVSGEWAGSSNSRMGLSVVA